METDSFFCQLPKQLPETLFELLGLPAECAAEYRFDSVEVKKSLRIDGLFVPKKAAGCRCISSRCNSTLGQVLRESFRQGVLLPGGE